mmetsp:Transcript_26151/g.83517  ORF Transcript_26151/g.83517 Transcript_26151/m.83517 type:complete len:428 (-) Transcript_26151:486-1769(-)
MLGRVLHDPVEHPLVVVILPRPPGVHALADEPHHDLHALLLRRRGVEALAQVGQHAAPPPREARAPRVLHDLDEADDALRVLAAREEPLDAQHLEEVEELARAAIGVAVHDLEQLPRELEGGGLEVDPPGGVGEHEAKVDVDDVPLLVHEYVAVVPVLDLEDVAHNRVGRHALHEGPLGLHELRAAHGVPAVEVVQEAAPGHRALDGVQAQRVGDALDERGLGGRHEDLVGAEPEGEAGLGEDLVELPHQLHGEELLAAVVSGLDDHAAQVPVGAPPMWARLPQPRLPRGERLPEDRLHLPPQRRRRPCLLHGPLHVGLDRCAVCLELLADLVQHLLQEALVRPPHLRHGLPLDALELLKLRCHARHLVQGIGAQPLVLREHHDLAVEAVHSPLGRLQLRAHVHVPQGGELAGWGRVSCKAPEDGGS